MRILVVFALLAAVLVSGAPADAFQWFYDGGPAIAGTIIKDGSDVERVAAPFLVKQESDATTFGAILGRSYGPAGAGVTVSLTLWDPYPASQVGQVLASGTLVPLSVTPSYYYLTTPAPIRLHPGQWYSLLFVPDDPGFACNIGQTIKPGSYYSWASNNDGASWYVIDYPACVRVGGEAIPEPSSWAALATGLALALRCFGNSFPKRSS